jgi:peptidoglycan hydrolase-like protein with peptidoglycan-binding domain
LERCTSREKAASAKQEFRKSVETVQLALASHQGVRLQNADRGVFNSKTRAALAAFQRFSGLPSSECNGLPTVMTLELLAASPYTVERFDVSP